jgi:hypothetical protein
MLVGVVSTAGAQAEHVARKLIPLDVLEGRVGQVSVSGSTAVVGVVITADATGPILRGAAYVFERDHGGPNAWGQIAKLTPEDPEAETLFGTSVAISGDTIVVGSPVYSALSAAYVFDRHQGGLNAWGQVAKLRASHDELDQGFGLSVSISGDTVVVGGNGGDTTPETARRGGVYVFARNRGGANSWGEVATLLASDGAPADLFGGWVSMSDTTLLVSAAESVYIFARDRGGPNAWGEVAKLTRPNPSDLFFGDATAISGNTVVITANPGESGRGSVYVYARSATNQDEWLPVKTLQPDELVQIDPENSVFFGTGVAIDGDTIIVGAVDDERGRQSGSAFVFGRHQGGTNAWGQIVKLAASDGHEGAQFGASVSISGTTAVIAAPPGSDTTRLGSAYVCDVETLKSPDGPCRRALPVVNDRISMSDLTTSCCDDSTFVITATFTNTSAESILNPFFVVTELTGGNLLQNADGAPRGVGATLTPDVGDHALSPGESTIVTFVIHLTTRNEFRFLVSVRGEPL